jgi:hypothetical protein
MHSMYASAEYIILNSCSYSRPFTDPSSAAKSIEQHIIAITWLSSRDRSY